MDFQAEISGWNPASGLLDVLFLGAGLLSNDGQGLPLTTIEKQSTEKSSWRLWFQILKYVKLRKNNNQK